jgi:N-acetylglucosaminyl-diphospho-decaprenol L-rhamnosyltransferase
VVNQPELVVVVVTFKSSELIPTFLRSVHEATSGRPLIQIADNSEGSDPRIRDVAAADADVHLVELPANRGYGGAVNAVTSELGPRHEWLLIANPDVTFAPGSIDALLEAARAHPRGGAFGPRILTSDGETYPSARRLPSLRNGIGHAVFHRFWPNNPWSARYLDTPESYEIERTTGWLSGACLLVRRSVFDAVGGFSKEYFMYFEDVDLGKKVGETGYENVFVPSSVVHHLGAHSTAQASKRMNRAHHESAYTYLAAKYRVWYLWPLRAVLRVGLWIRLALTLRHR